MLLSAAGPSLSSFFRCAFPILLCILCKPWRWQCLEHCWSHVAGLCFSEQLFWSFFHLRLAVTVACWQVASAGDVTPPGISLICTSSVENCFPCFSLPLCSCQISITTCCFLSSSCVVANPSLFLVQLTAFCSCLLVLATFAASWRSPLHSHCHLAELRGGPLIPAHADSLTFATQTDRDHCHSILLVHHFNDLLLCSHGIDGRIAIANMASHCGWPCQR